MLVNSDVLYLPHHLDYQETIASIAPFDWKKVAAKHGNFTFIVRPDCGGLLECVSSSVASDYLQSGEYDERLDELGDSHDLDIC